MIRLPENAALLLDLDGTLIDIAATPDSVVVPSDLPPTLLRLRATLSDALAIVTGRPIAQVEALLPNIAYGVAGEHGGVVRLAPHAVEDRAEVAPVPEEWLVQCAALVAATPGAILERKARGLALHFRLAPEAGPHFHDELVRIMGDWPHHILHPALMVWEVKPAGIDKGRAVRAMMAAAPFAGRMPVFIGDDVTDEDGMREARRLGGLGLRVHDHFTDAAGVRRWLAEQLV